MGSFTLSPPPNPCAEKAAGGLPHAAWRGDPVPPAGWSESSWDLQRGLEVSEGLPGDASLNEWLAQCLRR